MKYQGSISKLLSSDDERDFEVAKGLISKIESPDALKRFSKNLNGKTRNILRAKKNIKSKIKKLKGIS